MLMRDCSAMRQTLALSVCTEQRVAQIQSEAGEGPALLLHCRHGRSRGVSVANFCKVVITGSSLMRIKQGQAACMEPAQLIRLTGGWSFCNRLQTCTNRRHSFLAVVVPGGLLVCSLAQKLSRGWCMSEIFCNNMWHNSKICTLFLVNINLRCPGQQD